MTVEECLRLYNRQIAPTVTSLSSFNRELITVNDLIREISCYYFVSDRLSRLKRRNGNYSGNLVTFWVIFILSTIVHLSATASLVFHF